MTSQYPFSGLKTEVPEGARSRAFARLATVQKRERATRFSFFTALALSSIAGFLASCAYVWSVVSSSGFTQYLSIVFSDGASAMAYWKELLLSLAESVPALGIAAALIAGLSLAWSLSRLSKRERIAVLYA